MGDEYIHSTAVKIYGTNIVIVKVRDEHGKNKFKVHTNPKRKFYITKASI